MLQSSKDRAKPSRIGFAGEFWFRAQAVAAIGRVRADSAQTREQRITSLTRLAEVAISPQLAPLIADMTAAEWDAVSKEVDNALRTLYQPGIRPEQLDAAKAAAATSLPPASFDLNTVTVATAEPLEVVGGTSFAGLIKPITIFISAGTTCPRIPPPA